MKYKFDLINPYSPRSKCGAEALIGAGLGLGSSIFNGISTSSTNASNRKWTSVENEKNRQFNSRESQKQRDWAHDEWLSQFNKQSQEWYNQQATLQEQQWQNFLRQADYNSPRNQVSRMADAGFNPSAAFSQGSSGLVSAATGNIANVPSPSVPTGGTVSGNAASASPVSPLNAPAPQVDLGSLGSFLANAGKAYNENKKLRPEIDTMLANIQNVIADTANKELLNIAQTMENDILEQTKNAKVQKAWQDLKLAFVETNLKMAQGEFVQAQTLHEYVSKYLDECKAKLTVEQYMQSCIYTANMQKILDSEIQLNNSKAAEAVGVSEKLMREVFELKDTYTSRRSRILMETGEQAYKNSIISRTMEDVIQLAHNNNLLEDTKVRQAVEDLRHVTTANELDEWKRHHENVIANSPIRWIVDQLAGGIVLFKR